MGVRSYWGALKTHAADEGTPIQGSGLSKLSPVLGEILTHKRFGKCDETEDRKTGAYVYLLCFWPAIRRDRGLYNIDRPAAALGGEGMLSPYPTISFVKLFAYPGAVAGVIGIGLITINRFKHQEKVGIGGYFDWLLITVIILLMVTGVGAVGFQAGKYRRAGISDLFRPSVDSAVPLHVRAVLQDGPHGLQDHSAYLCPRFRKGHWYRVATETYYQRGRSRKGAPAFLCLSPASITIMKKQPGLILLRSRQKEYSKGSDSWPLSTIKL